MSKERLEEIDRVVDDLLNNRGELTNFVNDYYLQAEQVQELEEVNENLGYLVGKMYGENSFDIKKLTEQNKRYREALNRIKATTKEGTTYRWAKRALEELE